jgi:hypothetical protein
MDTHLATEVAYTNGFRAGKKAAINQLFADLEKEVSENSDNWCYQPKDELLDRIAEFKKKYGVK